MSSPRAMLKRITLWRDEQDEQIVDHFRKKAAAEGSKYPTLINESLNESMHRPPLLERIRLIEKNRN